MPNGVTRLLRKLFGLDQWRPVVARPDRRTALSLQYRLFKELITSNDEILELIAEVEQKLQGDGLFGMTYVRSRCVNAATHAYRMIQNINKLSSRRYQELYGAFNGIQARLERLIDRAPPPIGAPSVYPLSEVDLSLAERVGTKSANLGELRNRAKLPVPDGFAISTGAFLALVQAGQLRDEIRAREMGVELQDQQSLAAASASIREAILRAPLPAGLETSILGAYRELEERLGSAPRVSLRSSAVGEDTQTSFAGQYVSVLNVAEGQLLGAYREVLAGLYTPQAIYYRAVNGILEEDVPMGAACVAMVDALASGVAASADPSRPDSRTLVINGSWGLGVGTVGGCVSPDFWEVEKGAEPRILSLRLGTKEIRVDPLPQGGVGPSPVEPALRERPCLAEEQVLELARLVMAAEKHYGAALELEWALDRLGRFQLLQCRPLRLGANQGGSLRREAPEEVDGHPLLLTGAGASGGCRWGPVVLASSPEEPGFFPEGGVLVARHSSPEFVKILDRAAAVVTDVGGVTGHMASLAREFGVPAVLDTQKATALLRPGQVVTVDADHGAVYEGRVDSLLTDPSPRGIRRTIRGTPIYQVLQEAARLIVPLHLTDPRSPDFQPSSCRSFHDIARFIHEKAFEEMFRVSDQVADGEARAVRLEARLPFEVYLIDLGGGLAPSAEGGAVRAEEVTSGPMRALLAGMTNPELRWWEPRAISVAGFVSVAAEALFSPHNDLGQRRLGDRSYAIVADAYCNFSSRIGYHFAAVDAYCSDSLHRNYVSFRFKGGAADEERRTRRCAFIAEVLSRLDFQVERQGDLVNGRLRKFGKEILMDRLDQVGRLIIATRQLDMRMGPGTSVDWHASAFLSGNYLFDPAIRPEGAGREG